MWRRKINRLGVGLHRDGLAATEVNGARDDLAPVWTRWFDSEPCFVDGGALRPEAFDAAWSEIAGRLGRRYVPLRIALPDPLVTMRVFELDAVPATERERRTLAEWRLARELETETGELVCTHQYLGKAVGRHLLLASGASRALVETLQTQLKASGVFAVNADAAAAHRFNAAAGRQEENQAWLVIERDYWTLTICDERTRPRHVRSRWRSAEPSLPEEMTQILDEVERTVLAYVQGGPGRQVARLQVTGPDEAIGTLSDRLSNRPWSAFAFPAGRAAECKSYAGMAAALWQ